MRRSPLSQPRLSWPHHDFRLRPVGPSAWPKLSNTCLLRQFPVLAPKLGSAAASLPCPDCEEQGPGR